MKANPYKKHPMAGRRGGNPGRPIAKTASNKGVDGEKAMYDQYTWRSFRNTPGATKPAQTSKGYSS